MSDRLTIASLQRTVAEQAAEVLRLRALLVSCDERLDELGCGACYVPPTASVEAVPEAVGEAMTTMRRALAKERRRYADTVKRLRDVWLRGTVQEMGDALKEAAGGSND